MSRQSEISPFLGRDYRHVEHYAPASDSQADRDRRDRLKAKMLCERLLFKKWQRNGTLEQRVIQRIGDHGRKWGIAYLVALYWAWVMMR